MKEKNKENLLGENELIKIVKGKIMFEIEAKL